jgi:hypothetical protein
LQEHAAPFQGKLRITPSIPGLGLGGVWLDTKQLVTAGFETTFQIQITEKHSSGADGLAFAIQGGVYPAVGRPGQGLGYGGVTNQFVVHFDNYHWGEKPTAGRYDEIAVLAASSPTQPLYNVPENIIASVNRQIVFSDGAVHTVKIVYLPGNLRVFLDDLANPVMTVYLNLEKLLNLDNGRAWVGFTAASGSDWQCHDLVSWTFDSTPASLPTSAGPSIYLGNRTEPQPANPLLADPAFGYQLPSEVGLTHRVLASTNLVEWAPLTNASYYFRDWESTNYPFRFYRFTSDASP